MKKIALIVVISAITFGFTNAIFQANCLKAEGEEVTEIRDLASFTEIKFKIPADLILKQEENKNNVEIKIKESLLENLSTEVENGVLTIDFKKCVRNMDNLKVTCSFSELSKLGLYGSGDIKSIGLLKLNNLEINVRGSGDLDLNIAAIRLDANIDGSGDIQLEGGSNDFKAQINGSGDIDADDFLTVKAEAQINGSGDITLNVTESLDASINGSGDINYLGNPTHVERSVRGSGDVRKL